MNFITEMFVARPNLLLVKQCLAFFFSESVSDYLYLMVRFFLAKRKGFINLKHLHIIYTAEVPFTPENVACKSHNRHYKPKHPAEKSIFGQAEFWVPELKLNPPAEPRNEAEIHFRLVPSDQSVECLHGDQMERREGNDNDLVEGLKPAIN